MKPIINNAAIQLFAPTPGDTRPRNAFGILTGFGDAYSAHYAAEDRRKTTTIAQLKRDLAGYRKAAKWKSKVGPQEDAACLWATVDRLQKKIQALANPVPN